MVIKLNFNTVLAILGGLGVFAPDVAFIASFLAQQHVSWLAYPARILGFIATLFAAAPLIVPKLRSFLALVKLATPPGEVVPMTPANSNAKDLKTEPDSLLLGGSAIAEKELASIHSETTNRPKDVGFIDLDLLLKTFLLACVLTAFVIWIVLCPKIARADEKSVATVTTTTTATSTTTETATATVVLPPIQWTYDSKYGTCKGKWCLAPALAVKVVQYVPATGDMTGGVAFAGGYGIVWHSIVDLGLAFYGALEMSRDTPFTAQGMAMFNVANYVSFGPGFQMLGQSSGPAKFHLTFGFAANWIPGLVTSN